MASIRTATEVRLWSRQGKDLTDRFPDVQAALQAQLDIDCVLDGEIMVWTGEKLDFGQLQLRLVTSPAKARKLVAERPASFVFSVKCCVSPARRVDQVGRMPSWRCS